MAKRYFCLFLMLLLVMDSNILAAKTKGITIIVTGDPNKIGAIGLSYTDSKGTHQHGKAKATYKGTGFMPGLEYKFGYRQKKLSKGIPCGEKVLNKSATIWLDIKKNGCQPIIQ